MNRSEFKLLFLILTSILILLIFKSALSLPKLHEVTDEVNRIRKDSVVSRITPVMINKATVFSRQAVTGYFSDWEQETTAGIPAFWLIITGLMATLGSVVLFSWRVPTWALITVAVFATPALPHLSRIAILILAAIGIFTLFRKTVTLKHPDH